MRRTISAVLSALVIACCCQSLAAEETSSRWSWLWPFSAVDEAEPVYPETKTPAPREGSAKFHSTRHRITMPDMPEIPKPQMPGFMKKKEATPPETPKSAWMDTKPEPAEASPWQVAKESTQRLGQSTRTAWNKTVDVLTPEYLKSDQHPADHSASQRVAQRPPMWKRALGMEEEPPQGPQTVTEWMGQERLNP